MALPEGSGQVWIWVAGQEAVGGLIVDERVVGQPLDRAAGGTGVEEGVPRREQAGMLLVEMIFEPSMLVSAVQNTISPVCGLISHRCS